MNTTVGGLDIDALVNATIQAKSLPITLLQNKNSVLQAQLNDYNTIKSSLRDLQYAVNDLTYSNTFTGRTAKSSDETIVTASTSSGAANGSYAINVKTAATTSHTTSAALSGTGSKAAVTGSKVYDGTGLVNGTLTINGVAISVNAVDTLDDIVTGINNSAAGVTASKGADGKVTITQNTVGAAPTITLADNSGFLAGAGITQSAVKAGTDPAILDGSKAAVTGTNVLSNFNDPISGNIHAGSFYINNQRIDVTTADTINTIVNKISASSAGVTASIDSVSGKITLSQKTVGATPTITIGSDNGTGFFTAAGITQAGVKAGADPLQAQTLQAQFSGVTKGYFSINGTYFAVDPSTDTINSIINKINNSTTAGVLAFYDSNTHTVSLTSQTAGAKAITLGSGTTDTSNFLSTLGLASATTTATGLGTDAQVTVNDVAITPVNNQVSMNGNTFSLTGKTGLVTVSVQNDLDSIVTKVQTFITKYNATMDAINSKVNEGEGKIDSSSDASVGDLFGDPTLQSINQMLRGFTSTIVSSQPSFMQQLSQVGISGGKTFDLTKVKSGHLELDTTKFKSALQTNLQAVTSLFGNTISAVNNEAVGTGNGSTIFNLKHGSLSGAPTIQVDGVTYTQVSGSPRADVPAVGVTPAKIYNEYSVDYTTGKITFGTAPATGKAITANYNYDISSGGNAGIFVQMNTKLNSNTQVGGTIDSLVGSNGSLSKMMTYNNDRISDLKTRLVAEQATLYTKYQNMQTIYQSLQAQGSYMTSLLASLNSSK
jgi:flagellar hook-associated protein 2